jgi:hypothetical protein
MEPQAVTAQASGGGVNGGQVHGKCSFRFGSVFIIRPGGGDCQPWENREFLWSCRELEMSLDFCRIL